MARNNTNEQPTPVGAVIGDDPNNPFDLPTFEGDAITELGMSIPGAGGGFREPLAMDPSLVALMAPVTKGDVIYVVLELVKANVHMDPAKGGEGWKRVDIFDVNGVAVVDGDLVSEVINDQRSRVDAAKQAIEDAKPIRQLRVDEAGDVHGAAAEAVDAKNGNGKKKGTPAADDDENLSSVTGVEAE